MLGETALELLTEKEKMQYLHWERIQNELRLTERISDFKVSLVPASPKLNHTQNAISLIFWGATMSRHLIKRRRKLGPSEILAPEDVYI